MILRKLKQVIKSASGASACGALGGAVTPPKRGSDTPI